MVVLQPWILDTDDQAIVLRQLRFRGLRQLQLQVLAAELRRAGILVPLV